MASVTPRHNKNGSISWRVKFRRKGIKTFCTAFTTQEKAIEFADKYENKYCLNPDNFNWDHLKQIRLREFGLD